MGELVAPRWVTVLAALTARRDHRAEHQAAVGFGQGLNRSRSIEGWGVRCVACGGRWPRALPCGLIAAWRRAADAPLVRKAPPLAPSFDWSGFYAGGHVGYGRGSTRRRCPIRRRPMGASTSAASMAASQAGTTTCFRPGFLVGIEGDVSFPEFFEDGVDVAAADDAQAPTSAIRSTMSRRSAPALATSFGNTMLYGTGGLATR